MLLIWFRMPVHLWVYLFLIDLSITGVLIHMERYKNLGGDSNIVGFEIGPDSVTVKFKPTGRFSTYIFTYQSAGMNNVEKMKNLAIAGSGLNSFIMLNVKEKYSSKY